MGGETTFPAEVNPAHGPYLGDPPKPGSQGAVADAAPIPSSQATGLSCWPETQPVNQKLVLQGVINRLGYQADATTNGLMAVRVAMNKPYDLILMDVHMPEMDGFAATQQIRAFESTHGGHVPIVALTAGAGRLATVETLPGCGHGRLREQTVQDRELLMCGAPIYGSAAPRSPGAGRCGPSATIPPARSVLKDIIQQFIDDHLPPHAHDMQVGVGEPRCHSSPDRGTYLSTCSSASRPGDLPLCAPGRHGAQL